MFAYVILDSCVVVVLLVIIVFLFDDESLYMCDTKWQIFSRRIIVNHDDMHEWVFDRRTNHSKKEFKSNKESIRSCGCSIQITSAHSSYRIDTLSNVTKAKLMPRWWLFGVVFFVGNCKRCLCVMWWLFQLFIHYMAQKWVFSLLLLSVYDI